MINISDYIPGGGMLSPNRDIFYLNLPKNASTYLTNILKHNNWSHWNIIEEPVNVQSSLVVLRDPVERWISGFGTYAALRLFGYGYGSDHFVHDYNDLTERLIFDQIIFDDHTDFQLKYAEQVIDYNPVYFRCNNNLIQQINSYLGYDLNTDIATDDNKSESNYDTAQITQFIQKRIINKPDLKSKIVLAYIEDYRFIKNIDFYNDPR